MPGRSFYANRQTVDPPIVRMGVWFVVVPMFVAAVVWVATESGPAMLRTGRVLFVYRRANCTVLDEWCESQTVHRVFHYGYRRISSSQEVEYWHYRPQFEIEFAVAGERYRGWTYDAYGTWYDEIEKAHILSLYKPGDQTRCWYDPADPSKVVLTRAISFAECARALLPMLALALPAGLLWMSWPLMFYRGKNRRPRNAEADVKA